MVSGKQAKATRQAKIAAAAPKPSRARLWAGLAVAVLALAGIVAAVVFGTRGSAPASAAYPRGATGDDGGIVVSAAARPGAPVLDMYEDFQCPACKAAESTFGATIDELARTGQAKVVVHLRNFLENNPGMTQLGRTSSTRAAVGGACAADAGKLRPYAAAVFAGQPEQEGAGYSDDQLASFAQAAGITGGAFDTWTSCVKDKRYRDYISRVDDKAARDGWTVTPTYLLNGSRLDLGAIKTAEKFRTTVLAAAGATAGATTVTPAPVPPNAPSPPPVEPTAVDTASPAR